MGFRFRGISWVSFRGLGGFQGSDPEAPKPLKVQEV